ncbi:hypothetical protein A2957_01920 [Candidatus Roizmanbacteria bacterium RIFCSPLOWO2_01_FULL_38_11]|uniref:Outer membrane protein assembly factor BamB n=1 Tax=Candidatus Roizmanbacteria bacterium RIFCSPLOWO2_01_FULL_38_11 TaxID=1802060 RepID=A0A1F7ILF1_9BACT|nr:MAG: hypothetical protein A2957_01920 [Candidatus Roizmanbacteria bacterium RIFCSPLOWO2_01_FULL_38_11]
MKKTILIIIILIPSIVIAFLLISLYAIFTNYPTRQVNRIFQKNILWQINTNRNKSQISDNNDVWINEKHNILLTLCAQSICAYKIPSGKLLYEYKFTEKYRFHISTEINDDIYIFRSDKEIVAINIHNGRDIWRKNYKDEGLISTSQIFNSDYGSIGKNDVLVVYRSEPGSSPYIPIFDGFNIYTGEHLWSFKPRTYAFAGIHAKVFGDKLIIGNDYGNLSIYSIMTGLLEQSINISSDDVYPIEQHGQYLILRKGINALKGIVVYDSISNAILWSNTVKKNDLVVKSVCVHDFNRVVLLFGGVFMKSEIQILDLVSGTLEKKISLPTEAELVHCNDGYVYAESVTLWPEQDKGAVYIINPKAGTFQQVVFDAKILPYSTNYSYGALYIPSQDSRLYKYEIGKGSMWTLFGLLHPYQLQYPLSTTVSHAMGKPLIYRGIIYVKGADGYIYAVRNNPQLRIIP